MRPKKLQTFLEHNGNLRNGEIDEDIDCILKTGLVSFKEFVEFETDVSKLMVPFKQIVELLREYKPIFVNTHPYDEIFQMCCFFCREIDDVFIPALEILYEFMKNVPNEETGRLLIENGLEVIIPRILDLCESDVFRFKVLSAIALQSVICRDLLLALYPNLMENLCDAVSCSHCAIVPSILKLLRALVSHPVEDPTFLHLAFQIMCTCVMKEDEEAICRALAVLQFTTENQPLAYEILHNDVLTQRLQEMIMRGQYVQEIFQSILPICKHIHPSFRNLMMQIAAQEQIQDETFYLCVTKLIRDSITEETIEDLIQNGASKILKDVDELGSFKVRKVAAEAAKILLNQGSPEQTSSLIEFELWTLLIHEVGVANTEYIPTMIMVVEHTLQARDEAMLANILMHMEEADTTLLRESEEPEAVELCRLLDTACILQ